MISSNVKHLMAARGLTNHALATKACISADTVVRTKSARIKECSLETLISIANTLQVQTKDLYNEYPKDSLDAEVTIEMPHIIQKLGSILKRKRLSIPHLTQKKVCTQLGLERAYLSKIERGLLQPTLCELIQLAQLFNTTASHILKLVEENEQLPVPLNGVRK